MCFFVVLLFFFYLLKKTSFALLSTYAYLVLCLFIYLFALPKFTKSKRVLFFLNFRCGGFFFFQGSVSWSSEKKKKDLCFCFNTILLHIELFLLLLGTAAVENRR